MNKKILYLIPLALLGSCSLTEEEVIMKPINSFWEKNQIQKFEFEINEQKTPKNIIFVVRNNNDYPYSNLRVFSKIYNSEEKNTKTDTLNYILAKPNGEWLGSGFGETKEILFQYKMNYIFPKKGKYVVEVQHAMRRDTLVGIEDFGIKIEPTKP